jgi:hypothetical protein
LQAGSAIAEDQIWSSLSSGHDLRCVQPSQGPCPCQNGVVQLVKQTELADGVREKRFKPHPPHFLVLNSQMGPVLSYDVLETAVVI